MDLVEKVEYLIENIGWKLPAVAVGAESSREFYMWFQGEKAPEGAVERVDALYWIVRVLGERDSMEVVRALLVGMWPEFDDRSPIEMVREGKDLDGVVATVRSVVGSGYMGG